jgi:hypothetical protein
MILDDRIMAGDIEVAPHSVNPRAARRFPVGLILLPAPWHSQR